MVKELYQWIFNIKNKTISKSVIKVKEVKDDNNVECVQTISLKPELLNNTNILKKTFLNNVFSDDKNIFFVSFTDNDTKANQLLIDKYKEIGGRGN